MRKRLRRNGKQEGEKGKKREEIKRQFRWLIGPLHCLQGFPFLQTSSKRCVEVMFLKTNTHSAQNKVKMQPLLPLFCRFDSLRRAFRLLFMFSLVLFPPRFRHPAAFVEPLAHNPHGEAQDILCHLHPVHIEFRCDSFLLMESLCIVPSWRGQGAPPSPSLFSSCSACFSFQVVSLLLIERFAHLFC